MSPRGSNKDLESLKEKSLPQLRAVHSANDELDYLTDKARYYSDDHHRDSIRVVLRENRKLASILVRNGVDSGRLRELGYNSMEKMAKRFVEPNFFQKIDDHRRKNSYEYLYRIEMYRPVSELNSFNKNYFARLCDEMEVSKVEMGMPVWRDVKSLMRNEKKSFLPYKEWMSHLGDPVVEAPVEKRESEFKEQSVNVGSGNPVYMKSERSPNHQLVSSNFALGILDLVNPARGFFYTSDMRRVFDTYFDSWSSGSVKEEDESLVARLYDDIRVLPEMQVGLGDTMVMRCIFAASKLRNYGERSG